MSQTSRGETKSQKAHGANSQREALAWKSGNRTFIQRGAGSVTEESVDGLMGRYFEKEGDVKVYEGRLTELESEPLKTFTQSQDLQGQMPGLSTPRQQRPLHEVVTAKTMVERDLASAREDLETLRLQCEDRGLDVEDARWRTKQVPTPSSFHDAQSTPLIDSWLGNVNTGSGSGLSDVAPPPQLSTATSYESLRQPNYSYHHQSQFQGRHTLHHATSGNIRSWQMNDRQGPVNSTYARDRSVTGQVVKSELFLERDMKAETRILVTDPKTEREYRSFEKAQSPHTFFRFGKVFRCLWAEPADDTDAEEGSVFSFEGKYGERVLTKVRRFVVICEAETYCTAIPVSSYGGQGITGVSTKKSDHGIIFTGNKAPQPDPRELPNRSERPMRSKPVRVSADVAVKLPLMSRVNYGKTYTVEHNIKIESVGMVHKSSKADLLYQFHEVWQEKLQKSGRSLHPIRNPKSQDARDVNGLRMLMEIGYSKSQAEAIIRSAPNPQAELATGKPSRVPSGNSRTKPQGLSDQGLAMLQRQGEKSKSATRNRDEQIDGSNL